MESQTLAAYDQANVARKPQPPMNQGALVVTGGGRGIGAQIARCAAGAGTPVALIYRSRPDAAARVVDEIEAAGGRAIAIAADIGKEDDVLRAFEAVDNTFASLSGLVNNAVFPGAASRLVDLRMEELESIFRTNVFGSFLCSREAAKRMSAKNGGNGGGIVIMSSAIAVKSGAPGNWVHFAASKGALETMSLGLASELAPERIRVNVVRCGVIATETRFTQPKEYIDRALAKVPMARMGNPAEVASAVLWLLSEESSYVTGATLDVAGGL